ncbi:MAG: hypothetical protein JOS17DRAFT_400954 [Linnemannia elongata]|nr:MAG: hypothetical protein JOS17DRAFT_400954 [Linnemannia elongata]
MRHQDVFSLFSCSRAVNRSLTISLPLSVFLLFFYFAWSYMPFQQGLFSTTSSKRHPCKKHGRGFFSSFFFKKNKGYRELKETFCMVSVGPKFEGRT